MRKALTFAGLLVALLAPAGPLHAQGKGKEKPDPTVRSVEGTVSDAEGRLVENAVVHLKNSRTLQIRSFITRAEGAYAFHGLSTNVDYELRAEYQGSTSDTRTLSVFDPRRKAVIHLKLNKK